MSWFDSFRSKARELMPSFLVPLPYTSRPELNFEDYAKEAYSGNSVASACINLLAMSISGLPLKVYKEVGNEEKLLPDHPVWDLLYHPNSPKYKTWNKLQIGVWAFFYLNGNVYHRIGGIKGTPVQLDIIRPDYMEVKLNSIGTEITRYEFNNGTTLMSMSPEEIFHFSSFSPTNPLYGDPILKPAAVNIDQANMSNEWNVSLLKNFGAPSLMLQAEKGMPKLTPAQKKTLYNAFMERQAGYKHAGRPLVIGGGYEIKEIGWTPKDMEWLQGKVAADVAIAIVCGTPPELVGIQGQKTYSNYQEARKAYYLETVIPYAKIYLQELTVFLNYWFNDDLFKIGIDTDRVEALQEEITSKWKRVMDAQDKGVLTINEARKEMGLTPLEGADVLLVPTNRILLEDLVAGSGEDIFEDNPQPEEEKPDDESEEEEDE